MCVGVCVCVSRAPRQAGGPGACVCVRPMHALCTPYARQACTPCWHPVPGFQSLAVHYSCFRHLLAKRHNPCPRPPPPWVPQDGLPPTTSLTYHEGNPPNRTAS